MASAFGLGRAIARRAARRANRWRASLRSDLSTALAVALMLLILITLGVAGLVVMSARADEQAAERIPRRPCCQRGYRRSGRVAGRPHRSGRASVRTDHDDTAASPGNCVRVGLDSSAADHGPVVSSGAHGRARAPEWGPNQRPTPAIFVRPGYCVTAS
jgi:hypothetical protein